MWWGIGVERDQAVVSRRGCRGWGVFLGADTVTFEQLEISGKET